MLAEAGLTLTDATGTRFTVIAAVLLCPSLVAVIVTAPAATPVTRPVEDTVATAGALDAQATDRPESTLPAASFRVVVSCTVAPTSTTAVAGLITTEATGTFATPTLAVPLRPSLVAVIVTDPAATPVTRPAADTVAIAAFELVQLITRPLSTLPAASLVTALSCVVAPTKTFAVAGLTATEATGTLDTVTAAVPLWPSLVAVTVPAPTATPVTRPLAETVAIAPLLVVQVTVRPVSTLPLASLRVAVSCTVPPTYIFGVVGLTVTDATGTFATVTLAVPLCPSLVAVIVTAPAATPVTSPVADTVAIAAFELVQLITRPLSTLPAASLGVAVSCTVPPTHTSGAVGPTVTDATGTLETVTAAVALCPSLVAVIVTLPADWPVTRPLALTPASDVLLLDHVTRRPVRVFPAASLGVAVCCTVVPTYIFGVVGLTVTDATGTFATVTLAVPLCPSLVAVIVTAPAATPVTSPVADTVAIAAFELVQLITRPLSTLPAASLGVAVSCTVPPTYTFGAVGPTVTDATGTLETVTAAVALCPSLVAVIVTLPADWPVTRPLALTAASDVLLLDHMTRRPARVFPAASLGVAVSCTVVPTYIFGAAGLTVTDATGTFATVTLAVPLCPSLVAVIVTAPAATPITSPVADTLAIAAFELVHVITRPVNTFPAASFGVALSCCVAPIDNVADAGLTATEATETLVTARSAVPAMQ